MSSTIKMDPIITTLVVDKGPTQYICRVPKTLLCHHSKYFAAAYKGAWKETVEDRFVFGKDVDAEVLGRVLGWMYDGELGLEGESDEEDELSLTTLAAAPGDDTPRETNQWFTTTESMPRSNPLAAIADLAREAASREQSAADREQLRLDLEAAENGRLCADEWIEDVAAHPTSSPVSSPGSPPGQTPVESEQDVEVASNICISPADSWIEDLATRASSFPPLPSTSSDDDLAMLLEMYTLADRFDIPLLRLQIEYELENGDFEPDYKVVRRAYGKLPEGCGFLEWVGGFLKGEAEAVLT